MSASKERAVSSELLDLKTINEKLETLPHDSLMYVAGAISAVDDGGCVCERNAGSGAACSRATQRMKLGQRERRVGEGTGGGEKTNAGL